MATSLLLLGFWLRPATAQLLGPELQVNTYTTNSQTRPAVAADSLGNFVVVWQSSNQDSSYAGVFGQRFNSARSRVGSEFRVNTYITLNQDRPAVAADGSGNFVVVWESTFQDGSSYGVFGQRFVSAGSPVGGEFQVNSYTTSQQEWPAVAADASGNFVVVWQSNNQDGSNTGVFGQRFNSAGSPVGSEFRVNSFTTGLQRNPAVATDGSGNFVVVWNSYNYQDGDRWGVFGQRFDSAGSPAGSEFQINSYTTNSQYRPAVAADGSGNFTVVWDSDSQDGNVRGVFGQRIDSTGSPVGSELQINSSTTNDQFAPSVATDSSGDFLVAWISLAQDGNLEGVFGQRYSSAGSPVGSELQVNSYTTASQSAPAVAVDGSGNYVVTWNSGGQDGSGDGVFGQQLSAAGAIFSDGFEASDACAWSAAVGGGCP